jgi:hypothetical protein
LASFATAFGKSASRVGQTTDLGGCKLGRKNGLPRVEAFLLSEEDPMPVGVVAFAGEKRVAGGWFGD